jgi:hypothetical protein
MYKISQLEGTDSRPYANKVSIGGLGFVDLPKQNLSWHFCRDQFHRRLNKRKGSWSFLFSLGRARRYDYTKGKYVNFVNDSKIEFSQKFISHIEDRIKLAKSRRCKIEDTDLPGVVYIKMGRFWSSQQMRRSLFTALLRCSLAYNGKNFKTALWSRYYTSATKKAVERFLKGYTCYNGASKQGWYATFYPHCQDKVKEMRLRELLVKE